MGISGKIPVKHGLKGTYARPVACVMFTLLFLHLFFSNGFCQSKLRVGACPPDTFIISTNGDAKGFYPDIIRKIFHKQTDAINLRMAELENDKDSSYYQSLNHLTNDKNNHHAILPAWILWVMAGILFIVVLQLVINRLLYVKIKAKTREFKLKERQYRELVEGANNIILRWDKEGKVRFLNSFGLRFFGYSKEDIIGRRITDTILPNTSSEGIDLSKHIEKIITVPNDFMVNENENICKDGRRVFIQWSNRSIYDEDGRFLEMLSIGTDISERKRLEADLFQARKMEAIGTLAGGIAHDFNNILSIIKGYVDIIEMNTDPENEMTLFISKIKQASQRAKDLISKILAFSRRTESTKDYVPLSALVRETLAIIRPTFPATIKIDQLIENDCWIYGDSGQVHQVIMNLCTNAYHAMEHNGGTLTLHLELKPISEDSPASLINKIPAGKYICVTIADTGSGMSKDVIQKIYDPYFTTKEKGKGTGLGLAVVHGIIKDHKGHISVHSEPFKGTTFKIFFPALEKKIEISNKTDENPSVTGGNETLILVDDEPDIVDVSSQILENYGYTVEGFIRVEHALEAFKKSPGKYNLLITDMTMPGMTGARLAQEVLKIKPGFPIILCTGFSEVINKEKALQLGISEYIQKPADSSELLGKIRKLLDSGPCN